LGAEELGGRSITATYCCEFWMPARDVFVCHAHVDRKRYVRPLAEALARRSVSCWIDEAEIDPGESIVDAVNTGLRLARYVLLVVSDAFLTREWPRRELNAAFMREIRDNRVVVIPVLVTEPATWYEEFPLLADKLHYRWADGLELITEQVAGLFRRSPAADWVQLHPQPYIGQIWARCAPGTATTGPGAATLTFRWGPYVRTVAVSWLDGLPVSLIHHKTASDQVYLHVHSEPDSIVTFGQGPPPDPHPRCFTIDEGWTRAAGAPVKTPPALPLGTFPAERSQLAALLDLPPSPSDLPRGVGEGLSDERCFWPDTPTGSSGKAGSS
jgi:hypothetical protein